MTLTELHTAVMASPGPLEDEMCARVICAACGWELCSWRWSTSQSLTIACGPIPDHDKGHDILLTKSFERHERPDIRTDAALELVLARFPDARRQLYEVPHKDKVDKYQWVFGLDIDPKGMHAYFSVRHDDPSLAIIAALLKAMGA